MKSEVLTILFLINFPSILAGSDPCHNYDLLDMYNGKRTTDYQTKFQDIPICDWIYVQTGWWYKFVYNETNYKIPEACVQLFRCGTVAPIWMQGPHPTDYNELQQNNLCFNTGRSCCDLTASVNVTRCRSGHGGDFYVYQLTDPGSCHLGFCAIPSEENIYKGNKIQCDRRLGCSQVTVDLERHVGYVFEHSFICNYVDVDEGTTVTYGIISRTSTTAQCPIPDESNRSTQIYNSITKRYDLTVKYQNLRMDGIHVSASTVRVIVQKLGNQIVEDARDDAGSEVDLSLESDKIEVESGEDEIEHSSSALLIEPSTTKVEEFLNSGATSSKVSMQSTLAFRSGEFDTTRRSQVPAETNTAEIGKSSSTNSNRYSDDETFTASGLTLETSFVISTLIEPSETERATTSLTTSQQSMTESYSLSQTATETDIRAV